MSGGMPLMQLPVRIVSITAELLNRARYRALKRLIF